MSFINRRQPNLHHSSVREFIQILSLSLSHHHIFINPLFFLSILLFSPSTLLFVWEVSPFRYAILIFRSSSTSLLYRCSSITNQLAFPQEIGNDGKCAFIRRSHITSKLVNNTDMYSYVCNRGYHCSRIILQICMVGQQAGIFFLYPQAVQENWRHWKIVASLLLAATSYVM